MFQVLSRSWALLIGMMLLMVGNGLQGTLLGVRGGIEGFSTFEMSIVMSAYFAGFLGGSRLAPEMIRRVGHVRVFAALASFISAILILYPAFAHPVAWALGRVVIGFCFSGVYVTAESWLNNSSDNANRGKALSVYMIVQMFGIVSAQALLAMGDASGYALFILSSVLVSISFAPILLSISPTPAFETAKPMPLKTLLETSPLGCWGMFLLGGVFSAQFGMSAGLWRRHRSDYCTDLNFCFKHLCGRLVDAISDRLVFRSHGPAGCNHDCVRRGRDFFTCCPVF
jgi:MFS family permease